MNGKRGFTLIEILVSMAIFTILFGITIVAFQETRKIERIKGSTQRLVSDLLKAQNFASTGVSQGGTVPVGGYGVHLVKNATSYVIFADKAYVNSVSPASPCLACSDFCNYRYDGGDGCNDPTALITNLQPGVIIYDIVWVKSATESFSENSVDITFKPLESSAYIGFLTALENRDPNNGVYDAKPGLTVDIYMKIKDKDICRKLTIKGSTGLMMETNTLCP